jgi:hypothetical protein
VPIEHFRLRLYSAILHLCRHLEQLGSFAAALEEFPFLGGYLDEFAGTGIPTSSCRDATAAWDEAIWSWEAAWAERLPLLDLQVAAGLSEHALTLLFTAGLMDEDPRFGRLVAALQPHQDGPRPTVGLLTSWWGADGAQQARRAVRSLIDQSILEVANPHEPRSAWALQPPPILWDALRGDRPAMVAPWARYEDPSVLPDLEMLIVGPDLHARLQGLPGLMHTGLVQKVIVRGPESSGRRTSLKSVARACGRGCLELSGLNGSDDPRWAVAGSLATLLRAMPILALSPAPGESALIPDLAPFDGAIGITLPARGNATGPGIEQGVTLDTTLPDVAARCEHWAAALGPAAPADLVGVARMCRTTTGAIRRMARMALAEAGLEGRQSVSLADARRARDSLQAGRLDTLAVRVPCEGDWGDIVLGGETQRELALLEERCRCREELPGVLPGLFGAQLGTGVRALFTGLSGTGKSLGARLLAASLRKELYRLDLSSVVNKYLGETEKNLERTLSRAEALDVVLLIDEGDALMARRTDIDTSNDRYANLETDFLLQRLDTFEGILIVTTNAEQRMDEAFQRRLDAVVVFSPPGPAERMAIWALHLPPSHSVDRDFLEEIAVRCALTGGQIRNAVLHASLLAHSGAERVDGGHLEGAVRREYQKKGAMCPLRSRETVGG